MELNEKLQELRKQNGLTQEALAEKLYVSRAAVSKWESGRGYPSIDSLKAIARLFGVTVDALLSGDELLSVAEDDARQKETHLRDLVFGLLDCGTALLLFLPFFGQRADNMIQEVSLLGLTTLSPWLKAAYFAAVTAAVITGILTLALQNCTLPFWARSKHGISLSCGAVGVFLFIISRQPYAAAFVFVFLTIKTLLLMKKH